jgi:hypothetical protein
VQYSRRSSLGPRRGNEDFLTEAATELGLCQVRSRTDRPCVRPAVVKILGVPFCEQCAHEQEAYFAIGELVLARGPAIGWPEGIGTIHDDSLFEALKWVRRKFAGHVADARETLEAAEQEALR